MKPVLVLTDRQAEELKFAIAYARQFNHGTDGHHRLNLIATMATHMADLGIQVKIANKTAEFLGGDLVREDEIIFFEGSMKEVIK